MHKLIFALCSLFLLTAPSFAEESTPELIWRSIERVVDGDTICLDNDEKVRLIGIDTPEKHDSDKLNRDAARTGKDIDTIKKLGEKSSEFTQSLCDGKKCWLEYDTQTKDRYGRTLAYIHLDTGIVLNEEIVRQGYANAYTKYPFKYMDRFRLLEVEAREAKRGLWADGSISVKATTSQPTTPTTPPQQNKTEQPKSESNSITVYITNTGKKYHTAGCGSLSKSCIPVTLKDAQGRGLTPCSRCGAMVISTTNNGNQP